MNSHQNNRRFSSSSSSSSSSPFKRGGTGTNTGKKFCSVCQKKGLPESVYTSHFTRTEPGNRGIVVCPTILAAKCNYCGENGHWANLNYCAAMKYDEKMRQKSQSAPAAAPVRPVAVQKHNTSAKNFYGALDSDSDEEDTVPVQLPPVVLPKPGIGWAEMAKRAPVVSIPKPKPTKLVSLTEEANAAKNVTRWATTEDSDEECDDGYYDSGEGEYLSEEMENNYQDTASDEPDDPWKHFK